MKKLIKILHSDKFLNLKAYKKQLRLKSKQKATFVMVIKGTGYTNNLDSQACLLSPENTCPRARAPQPPAVMTRQRPPGSEEIVRSDLPSLGKTFSVCGLQFPHL